MKLFFSWILYSLIISINLVAYDDFAMRYMGSKYDIANWMQQTSDGGYVATGFCDDSGDLRPDLWVVRLNQNGIPLWHKKYGGEKWDDGTCIVQTADQGYLVTGSTDSFGAGLTDGWALKLKKDGAIQWQKAYGGTYEDRFVANIMTADGQYAFAGYTSQSGFPAWDLWLLKVNNKGVIDPACGTLYSATTAKAVVWKPRNYDSQAIIMKIKAGVVTKGKEISSPLKSELICSDE